MQADDESEKPIDPPLGDLTRSGYQKHASTVNGNTD